MIQPYVSLNIKNGVGSIEFFHPNQNALPTDLLLDLKQTIMDAGTNKAVKVIVLKSGGDRSFCAGASLNELVSIKDAETGKTFFSGFAGVINAMRTCSKLIIVRIQGKTVGGGIGLAAAADYCLATKYASIKLSELSIGIGPFVIEPAVSRKMGLSTTSQMALDAETFFTAAFAKDKGLYADVFETADALDVAVKALAEKLCSYNPQALSEMKTVFWQGTEHWDSLLLERAEISGNLVLSEFTKKTLERFI